MRKWLFSLVAGVVLTLISVSHVHAAETEVITDSISLEDYSMPDNDELFRTYVDHLFGFEDSAEDIAESAAKPTLKAARRDNLNEMEQEIYERLEMWGGRHLSIYATRQNSAVVLNAT